jgi:MFS family permease
MIKQALGLIRGSRDFALLLGTQMFAQAGDGIVQAALAKYIAFGGQQGFDLESARSPDELLRIALYIFVPYTILSPFFGVVIDRWDRRRLLFLANGLRAVVIALVALWGIGRTGDVALFGAFLLTLSSTRVVLATKSAALPTTLGGKDLVIGNAVSQMLGALFQIGGVAFAFIAAGVIEVAPIVLIGCVVYAIGGALALSMKRATEHPTKSTLGREIARVASNIAAGVREVAQHPKAAASITTYFWLRLLWSFSIAAVGFVARDLLADDDFAIAILTGGALAAGGGLGFLLARSLHDRARSSAHLVVGAAIMAGVAMVALGPLKVQAGIALLMFFLGLGFFLGKISLDTMVQEALGDDFRGRAFSLYDISYNLAWVVAAAILKIFWADEGQSILLAGMGLVFLIGVVFLAAWYRRAGLFAVSTPTAGSSP